NVVDGEVDPWVDLFVTDYCIAYLPQDVGGGIRVGGSVRRNLGTRPGYVAAKPFELDLGGLLHEVEFFDQEFGCGVEEALRDLAADRGQVFVLDGSEIAIRPAVELARIADDAVGIAVDGILLTVAEDFDYLLVVVWSD